MEAQKSLTEDWSFWVLSGLALLLFAAYYFSLFPFGQSDSGPEWILASLRPEQVEKLRSYKNNQLLVEVTRSGGKWEITDPPGVRVSSGPVEDWVRAVTEPELKARFERFAGQDYGFDSPPRTVEVVTADTTHRLYLGKDRPVGPGFYLRSGSGPEDQVYVVARSEKQRLARSLKDVRQTSLFSVTVGEVDQLALAPLKETGPQPDVVFDQGDTGWQLAAPRRAQFAETTARRVRNVVRSLLNLEATKFYDDKPVEFIEPLAGELVLTIHGRKHTLKVGKKQDGNRLVKLTGWPVIGVASDPLEELSRLPELPPGWPTSAE